MYDSIHRFHVVSTDPKVPQEMEQKGVREPLLCAKCEGRFSRYEKHASEAFFGDEATVQPVQPGFSKVLSVDYTLFRLFVLSMIWRMSESRLKMFANVDLGPHAEIIRKALLADDPLQETHYPFVVTAVTFQGKFHEDLILEPDWVRVDQYRAFRFIIRGLLFFVFVSKQPPPPALAQAIFRRTGGLLVAAKDVDRIPYLKDALGRMGERIRAQGDQQKP